VAKSSYRRILITGGAGFIGANLALHWKRNFPSADVIALDNLKRRGSELALSRLCDSGVVFVHGDIRSASDLEVVGPVDLLVECSAEPSVHAGYGQSPKYLLDTNLIGLVNCLEHLRLTGGDLVFLSSSRVYPIAALRSLPFKRAGDRLTLADDDAGDGWSVRGIAEKFPLGGARSLYGTTKFASELLIEEYRATYGLRALVNRCGVIAGPWQMGKVDQGFVALWMARHLFGGELAYSGFGGEGLQVRDVLHVDDLFDLLVLEIEDFARLDGSVFNVGGGLDGSVSLRELTQHCVTATGRAIAIGSVADTRVADIPWYVSDNRYVTKTTGWQPTRGVATILEDVLQWLTANRAVLQPILGG